jgi:hypothetical protein
MIATDTNRPKLIWLFVLLFIAGLYAAWTPSDGLGQLGRDGPRYMMMAQHYSVLQRPDPVYAEMATTIHLPPLYPVVLAWSGSANSLYRAHLVTTLCLLLAFVAYNGWLQKMGFSTEQAALLVLLFAMLPGTVLMGLLIQSEFLYLLLSLLALALLASYRSDSRRELLYGAALAVGAASLTRTIGVCLFLPLLLASRHGPRRSTALALLTAILPALAWHFLHHSKVDYSDQLQSLYGSNTWQTLIKQLSAELPALRSGLEENLLNIEAPGALADILGLLCLGCALLRAIRLEPDAAYLLAYLAIVLIWPYPEEAQRFLWVILPVLLIQPLLLLAAPRKQTSALYSTMAATAAFAALALLASLPVLVQLAGRYWSAPYSEIPNAREMVSWYGKDPAHSREAVIYENAFISAMQLVPAEVPETDCVLAARPDLVNYYAHRRSTLPPLNSVPDPQFAAMARSSGCNYVYGMAFKDNQFSAPLHPLPRLAGEVRVIYVNAVYDEASGNNNILAALARFLPPPDHRK